MTCDEQGEDLGREGCCCRERGTRIFRPPGGFAGGSQKVATSAVQRGAGADQHPLQPAAGAGSTPKPVSPRQVSYSTSAVKEAADQVPFPAEAVNQLLMGYSNNSVCLKRREKMGIWQRAFPSDHTRLEEKDPLA